MECSMQDQMSPTNELETALAKVEARGDLADWETRSEVLRQLALSLVYIIVDQPLDENTGEDIKGTPTFVSNGDDREQAMLAIFSTKDRASGYLEEQQIEGRYPLMVPGPRALLAVPEGAGIRLNPNQHLGFVIQPELAQRLSQDIRETLQNTPNTGSQ